MSPPLRAALAITCAVLMITTPVGAATTAPAPYESPTLGDVERDSLFHRSTAQDVLAESDMPDQKRQRLADALERTREAYVDRNRVKQSVFEVDQQVAGASRGQAPAVTESLIKADAKLARTALMSDSVTAGACPRLAPATC